MGSFMLSLREHESSPQKTDSWKHPRIVSSKRLKQEGNDIRYFSSQKKKKKRKKEKGKMKLKEIKPPQS